MMGSDANRMTGKWKIRLILEWIVQSAIAVRPSIATIQRMSRRSRRRRGIPGGNGWLGKAALGLIVAGVIGAGVLYAMIRGYLHSDGFRRFLSEKTSMVTGVEGNFTPFRWDGLAVDTSSFEGTGNGIVRNVKVQELHTEVGVGGLRRGVWEIRGTRVQRLEVSLDARNAGEASAIRGIKIPQGSGTSKDLPGWLPTKVELMSLDLNDVTVNALLDQGTFSTRGLKVRVEQELDGKKNRYRVDLENGTLRQPIALVPEIRLNHAKLRYQDGQVFITNSTASAWKNGRLSATGEWNAATGQYSAEGDVTSVKCDEVFNEDWAKRFTGDISSDFSVNNHTGAPQARGHLGIVNGTLTALPLLDSLAAYADTRRFRILSLSDARTDWQWKNGETVFTNLALASEGLMRLEGKLTIRGRQLDGSFRLGLAPGTLASIPGAETDVFSPGERGLVWASLRITGTLDDPKEDLTDRLITAAGMRMFDVIPETGEKVIKFTNSVLKEAPTKAIDAGTKILDGGTGIVEGVGGVLDSILGGGARKPEPLPKENPPPQ